MPHPARCTFSEAEEGSLSAAILLIFYSILLLFYYYYYYHHYHYLLLPAKAHRRYVLPSIILPWTFLHLEYMIAIFRKTYPTPTQCTERSAATLVYHFSAYIYIQHHHPTTSPVICSIPSLLESPSSLSVPIRPDWKHG